MDLALFNVLIYLTIILIFVKPLGWYMARVFMGMPCGLDKIFLPVERGIARCCGISLEDEMDWKQYLTAMLWVNLIGFLFVYTLQRVQYYLPLNPQDLTGVSPETAFNTAASFITNTDWQAYSGETTMSYLTQMLGLTAQQFLCVASGLAIMAAFIRGLVRHETTKLGNYWQDMMRSILYILLPLATVLALLLVSQGVIQNFKPNQQAYLLDPVQYVENGVQKTITTQEIPMGPVASMEAIKQLGTNGGGFFNANSAHPFENPNQITNYLEMIAIILIPAALCLTFGIMVNDRRQGWILLMAMLIIFIPLALISIHSEQVGNPLLYDLGMADNQNMEGKEVRIGVINSALWGSATTATSHGSVNSMHDSAMPMSGFVYLLLMQMGEIIFGGVGSGIYSMILTVIIAVFIAGLMVGRAPEYLGKKVEPFEVKMASLVSLVMQVLVLVFTAIACVTSSGIDSALNPGAHGFTEILYAFTSMFNNNGSAFAGLNTNVWLYNVCGALLMLISRFWFMIALLAIAGSLAKKKILMSNSGTLPTHDYVFLFFLLGVIVIIGTLTFLPMLALGPVVEYLNIWGYNV